ncbi:MAG: aminopeptidase [Oscillospiraceae bacterium]|nr:aminopeptidase [Oscillospiraceae bacterium]
MSNNQKKTPSEALKDELFYQSREATRTLSDEEIKKADSYCEQYRKFLNSSKTERETVNNAVSLAKQHGFVPFDRNCRLKPGDKVYVNNRDKALILAVIGTRPLDDGVSIAAAHIDSPRLDLKPNPLYEDHELAYFDTHYYGGIKKYQWTAIPLALHGVIMRKDGTKVEVVIGEDEGDPVFCVTDLLPHLSTKQMKRTAAEFIKGEDLNILIGSRAFKDDNGSELVKLNIMKILNEKYGIKESDFFCAELEAVPAFSARDVGFDRSMIGGYGHDDRVCSYPALTALLQTENPAFTAITVLADKEETGSDGNTGMQSAFLRYFIEDLAANLGVKARHVFSNSICLSADVNVAFDPIFSDVVDVRNCASLNHGVVLTKYTGSRGKADTSDASAELMFKISTLMEQNDVLWQIGELGRVDAGGGGTVAKYIANMDVDTVDLGVPVLSMHAPFEVVSKIDVYMAHKAFSALLGRK